MKIFRSKKWKGGWFAGDFTPAAYRTTDFEVAYKVHRRGERWPRHYHKIATEINYMISGKIKLRGKIFGPGDIFILKPGEIADPVFLTTCEMIVVKTPSVKGDKYES